MRKILSRVPLLFIAALAVLATIGVLSYINTMQLIETSQRVSHAYQVLATIESAYGNIKDAESARRGFALIQDPRQAFGFRLAAEAVQRDLRSLRELTADNAAQLARLDWLEPMVRERMAYSRELVEMQESGRLTTETQHELMSKGIETMQVIRRITLDMEMEEKRLLDARIAQARRNARNTILVSVFGTLVSFGLLIAVFLLLQSEIADRTAAEQALQVQSETLRRQARLLELTHDAIFLRDNDDRIVFWNRGAQERYGWSRDEAVGAVSHQLLRTESDQPLEQIQAHLREKGHWEGELTHSRRDGSRLIVSSRWALDRDERGEPSGVLEIDSDITERKRAENLLRESEERLRLIIDNVRDYAVFLLDPAGCVVTWNVGAERLKGYRADEIIGHDYTTFYTPQDIQAGKPQTALREAAERGRYEEEGQRRRKDGSTFWAHAILTTLRDGSGRLRGFVKVTRDVTKLREAEEARERYAQELRRSNEELQQFAYVASHDLQEPLRMVASYTQLLAKRYQGRLDEDADDFITFAVDGAQRMQGLIADLLAYSRIGSRGKEFVTTDINVVAGRAITNLQAAIEEHHATVTLDPLPSLMADDTQMVQLFQNLIGNGIKFHGEDAPRVHLSATRQEDNWLFRVTDNGIGIAPSYAERIFVIFQRLHTRAEYAGTGIGLAICKKIVERHGGRIWLESRPGKGSTFFFTLPVLRS